MATKKETVVTVTSDLSDEAGASTIRYTLGESKYEIDLTESEAGEFHEALAPYIAVSRVKGGRRGAASGSTSGGKSKREKANEAKAVREWATANGHEVPPQGRIPVEVRKAYDDAHAAPAADATPEAVETTVAEPAA